MREGHATHADGQEMGRVGEGGAPPASAEHVPRGVNFCPQPESSFAFHHHHPHRTVPLYCRHGRPASSSTRAGQYLAALSSPRPPPPLLLLLKDPLVDAGFGELAGAPHIPALLFSFASWPIAGPAVGVDFLVMPWLAVDHSAPNASPPALAAAGFAAGFAAGLPKLAGEAVACCCGMETDW